MNHNVNIQRNIKLSQKKSIHWLPSQNTWTLWKERNNRVFQSKASTALKLIDNVKLLSFWWLKAQNNIAFDYHMWWLSPLSCMGMRWILFLLLLCLFKLWCKSFGFFLDTPCAEENIVLSWIYISFWFLKK